MSEFKWHWQVQIDQLQSKNSRLKEEYKEAEEQWETRWKSQNEAHADGHNKAKAECMAEINRLKEAILKYGNNPAGFDWAVLEEIEKLKEAYKAVNMCNANYVKQITILTADLEAAKDRLADIKTRNIEVELELADKEKDLEAAKKQASFTPVFVSSAQNDELAKVKAELAEAREALIRCWAFAKVQTQWKEYDSDGSDTKFIEQALKGVE